MTKNIRQVEVYRINDRLVVANSLEGAIGTWREFMRPSNPDIVSIERMTGTNSYEAPFMTALLHGETIGMTDSNIINALQAERKELLEELECTKEQLKKAETYIQNINNKAGDDALHCEGAAC